MAGMGALGLVWALALSAALVGLGDAQQQRQQTNEVSFEKIKAGAPVAYFPLLDGSLDASIGDFKGTGSGPGVTFSDDRESNPAFANALECLDHEKGLVTLDNVNYGSKGDFSINLWLKQKRTSGAKLDQDEDDDEDGPSGRAGSNDQMGSPRFEYIFSHAKGVMAKDGFFPWSPSQIHLFLPDVSMPAHGVLRAVVKDSTDEYQGTMSQTYLDSDGRFMDNNPRNMPGHVDFDDGAWHMATITSNGSGKRGYRMYVDGVLAGEAPPSSMLSQLVQGLTASPGVQTDAGDPLGLTGEIHLCARVDKDEDRHFGGNLAHLALWDAVLTPEDVARLFSDVQGQKRLDERCEAALQSELAALDGIDPCPFLAGKKETGTGGGTNKQGGAKTPSTLADVLSNLASGSGAGCFDTQVHECVCDPGYTREKCEANGGVYTAECNCGGAAVTDTGSPLLSVTTSGKYYETKDGKFQACEVLESPTRCGTGMICMPHKILSKIANEPVPTGRDPSDQGRCVPEPIGGIFPPDASANVPLPVAFFPLTGGDVNSWPAQKHKGVAMGVDWVPDVRFEKAMRCKEGQGSHVSIPGVKYGQSGQFAINFWMKKDEEAQNESGFEYIFSHGESGKGFNPFGPNNVHIYLPEVAHPAHGVARVILKDSESTYQGQRSHTFFDSDGKFTDNEPRNSIGHVNLEDGQWHMLTVTTKTSGDPGFQIFVDGTLGGSFPTAEIANFLETSGGGGLPWIHVDGGAPLNIDGDIFLCGRADLSQERHFGGSLAHLSIFNESLAPEMVAAMYTAVAGRSVLLNTLADLASSIRALQPNVTESRPDFLETLRTPEIIAALRATRLPDKAEIADKIERGDSISCEIDISRSGLVSPLGCEEEGLVCAALHQDSDLHNGEKTSGVCVESPQGGIYLPSPNRDIPVPKAYFPLTGGNVSSWPEPKYSGVARGVTWVDDDSFGSVLQCEENNLDYVELDTVPYGENGQWAINFWMAHNGSTGETFEFLLSHANEADGDPWQPNEVQIYLPEVAHPAHGVIRTIVKDSNDVFTGPDSQTFLDSDGGFMNNAPRNVPGHTELDDGKWHMITLTTLGEGRKGYSIYVDGILGGKAPPAFASVVDTKIAVDGGDPLVPKGKMYLCGRNDLNKERHFGGRLAHLSLYDSALEGDQIMDLYIAGAGEAAALQRTMQLLVSQIPQSQLTDASDPLRSLNRAKIGEACYVRSGTYNPQKRVYENTLTSKLCEDGSICAPKANSPAQVSEGMDASYSQALHGQCVAVPSDSMSLPELNPHGGSMFFPNPLMNVPTPLAFFPLTEGKTDSWPSGLYAGRNEGADWVEDDGTFGKVLTCEASDNAFMALDPVPYAERGSFAVNFWIRQTQPSLGGTFEYVYSHSEDDGVPFSPWYPNQLHVYLPEISHPAHGVARVILKDSTDEYEGERSETYLDSDGLISDNDARDTPGHVDLEDGQWHMLTVTTRPDGGDGYAIFVDGILGGANFLPKTEEQARTGQMPFAVDGGQRMMLDGSIFLCGRNDGHPERHFKGQVSHLSLFDTALTPSEIASLFVSVRGERAYQQRLMDIAMANDPRVVDLLQPNTTSGDGPLVLRTDPEESGMPTEENGTKPDSGTKSKLDQLKDGFRNFGGTLTDIYGDAKDNPLSSGAAAAIGLICGLVLMGGAFGAYVWYKRRQEKRKGAGALQLPTISRNASIVAPAADSPGQEGTSNPLDSMRIKRDKSKASQYSTME